MATRLRILVVAVLLATLVAAIPGGRGMVGPEPVRAATTIEVCGTVTLYVAPSALLAGALTINGVAYVIAAGTTVPSAVEVDAYLCLRLTLDASGSINDIVVLDADATTTVQICGEVTAYGKATLTSLGNLTIAGRKFVLALGAELPAAVKLGADLCATLELNVFGQVKDGTVTANVTSSLEVCGQVTGFVAATATSDGQLTIGGSRRVIAAGTTVHSSVAVGVFASLRLELDVFARISKVTVLLVGADLAVCQTAVAHPSPGTSPGASPATSPAPSVSPAPSASPEPGSSTSPAPTTSPDPSGSAPGAGDDPGASEEPAAGSDVCPAPDAAAGSAGSAGSAPNLPDTSTADRAAQVIGTAAIPFVALALALLAWHFISRNLRGRRQLEPLAVGSDMTEGLD
ncbi:MAG TPA: hypothetical protein VMP67_01610 [Candidatus Limnocylindria bacterium]|nr:hypothetical protein [Candidatus Limnocylindria bacterium]